MPQRGVHPVSPYDHLLLAEYAQTLDALPMDLSRSVADLRELDAVLSSTMASITVKIHKLIDSIQDPDVQPSARLARLVEVAEEAQRLKMGADDKIRVASLAGDHLQAHTTYLSNLLKQIAVTDPNFAPSRHTHNTTYPHVIARPLPHSSPMETGRRRRVPANGGSRSIAGLDNPTPAKRRRARDDDDVDPTSRNSRRDAGDRDRDFRAPKQPRRAGSPAESMISITSHQHPRNGMPNMPSTPKSRARPLNHLHRGGPATPRDTKSLMEKVLYNQSPGNSPLVNPHGYPHTGPGHPYDPNYVHGDRWDGPADNGVLIGPGLGVEGEAEPDVDADEKTYCYCESVSYGDMIACDDDNCPREWFHLSCTGLVVPPKGTWYCDDCMAKQKNKRSRSGKRRPPANGGTTTGRTATAKTSKPITAQPPA